MARGQHCHRRHEGFAASDGVSELGGAQAAQVAPASSLLGPLPLLAQASPRQHLVLALEQPTFCMERVQEALGDKEVRPGGRVLRVVKEVLVRVIAARDGYVARLRAATTSVWQLAPAVWVSRRLSCLV